MISPDDLDLLHVTDDPRDAVARVLDVLRDAQRGEPAAPVKADAQ